MSSKQSDIKHSSLKNNRYDNDKNKNIEEDEKCEINYSEDQSEIDIQHLGTYRIGKIENNRQTPEKAKAIAKAFELIKKVENDEDAKECVIYENKSNASSLDSNDSLVMTSKKLK